MAQMQIDAQKLDIWTKERVVDLINHNDDAVKSALRSGMAAKLKFRAEQRLKDALPTWGAWA